MIRIIFPSVLFIHQKILTHDKKNNTMIVCSFFGIRVTVWKASPMRSKRWWIIHRPFSWPDFSVRQVRSHSRSSSSTATQRKIPCASGLQSKGLNHSSPCPWSPPDSSCRSQDCSGAELRPIFGPPPPGGVAYRTKKTNQKKQNAILRFFVY